MQPIGPFLQLIINKYMSKLYFSLFAYLLVVASSHNPHGRREELIFTIVTGIVDSPNVEFNQQMNTLKLMMTKTNFNFYVVIQPEKLSLVPAQVRTKRIVFIDANTTALGEVWLQIQTKISKLAKNKLEYTRLLWLNYARAHDSFSTDEFLWVDLLRFQQIEDMLNFESIDFLVKQFKHHLFFTTVPHNPIIHAFPGANETYFVTNFTQFIGKHFFGGRSDAIETIAMMYEDLLKVILVHDNKDWSEDAILSIFADRTPFLTSYLNLTNPQTTAKRLLISPLLPPTPMEVFQIFQQPSEMIKNYTRASRIIRVFVILFVVLILLEVKWLIGFVQEKSKSKGSIFGYSTVNEQQNLHDLERS